MASKWDARVVYHSLVDRCGDHALVDSGLATTDGQVQGLEYVATIGRVELSGLAACTERDRANPELTGGRGPGGNIALDLDNPQ